VRTALQVGLISVSTVAVSLTPTWSAPGATKALPAVQIRAGGEAAAPSSNQLPAVQLPAVQQPAQAIDLSTLTLDRLQALPESQLLRIGKTQLTKGELVRRMGAVHGRPAAALAGGTDLVRRHSADLATTFHGEVEANNSQVMARHQAPTAPLTSKTTKVLPFGVPKITTVWGKAMDGAVLMIEGSNLGD
jgi:hypothetical protein